MTECLPAKASPRPSVPDVDSTTGAPGRSTPRSRASSSIDTAGRAFIPPAASPSSLAQNPGADPAARP
ncbi:hypothetical protein ACFQV4_28685 [Streptomyces thermocarboxydus]